MVRGDWAAAKSDSGNSKMNRHPPLILATWPTMTRGQRRCTRSPLGSAPYPDGQIARRVPRQHDTPNRGAASLPPTPSRGEAIAVGCLSFAYAACDNILSGYLCAVTTIFSQQDRVFTVLNSPKAFWRSFPQRSLFLRDLTLFSILI